MASTATFTSCKDYDDDIDNLQSQITANADAIKKLQDLVGAGKFVTNVSKVTDGITITWNDGSSTTLNGTDGKDGADGKDGSVITIGENNNWFIDGKDTGVCTKGEKGDKGDQGEKVTRAKKVKTAQPLRLVLTATTLRSATASGLYGTLKRANTLKLPTWLAASTPYGAKLRAVTT